MAETNPIPARQQAQVNAARLPIWLGAVAGFAAAAFGLAVAEVIAGLRRNLRSPVLDVGDRVVDRVPAFLKNIAIELFGTNDKVALLVGIGSALAIYACVVGIAAARNSRLIGDLGILLFVVLGVAAAVVSRTGTNWVAALPSLVGGLVAGGMLRWLVSLATNQSKLNEGQLDQRQSAHPSHRRRFLAMTGGTLLGAGVIAASGRQLQARFNASTVRGRLALPSVGKPLADVPKTVQSPAAAPFFTPNSDFYRIDTALSLPQVDIETWSLSINGMVGQELTLSYEDLIDRPLIETDITLTCVSNTIGGYLIGTARWLGVRLDDLLDDAGIDPGADQIVGRSVDGYTCGFPTEALDGRDAIVAIGMNGEILPIEHGYPARLVVPGIYGYASATKWLQAIELTTFDAFDHYWVPRGYSELAPIKTQSRIDAPRGLDRIPPGPFVIGGVAWAQPVGIEQVEVSIDEGQWLSTTMASEVNGSTWRQWSYPWEASPGRHTVQVRAIDKKGAIQTIERSEPLPNGASGYHKIVVLVDEA